MAAAASPGGTGHALLPALVRYASPAQKVEHRSLLAAGVSFCALMPSAVRTRPK
jgi:hypothetical protein